MGNKINIDVVETECVSIALNRLRINFSEELL
jgi:hypothetical protein